jgi:hypothetical protein
LFATIANITFSENFSDCSVTQVVMKSQEEVSVTSYNKIAPGQLKVWRVEGWRVGRLGVWRAGGLELEGWKAGGLEGWKKSGSCERREHQRGNLPRIDGRILGSAILIFILRISI